MHNSDHTSIGIDWGAARARVPTKIGKCPCIYQFLPHFLPNLGLPSIFVNKSTPVQTRQINCTLCEKCVCPVCRPPLQSCTDIAFCQLYYRGNTVMHF